MTSSRFCPTAVFASGLLVLTLLLGVTAACQSNQPQAGGYQIVTATPGAMPGGPTFTPEPTLPYIIAGMPLCPGLQNLNAPLKFDWPDIENAIGKLASYNWGYYRCGIPTADLINLVHDKIVKPPYLWQSINMAEYKTGRVSLFYQPFQVIWLYIWMLPGPDPASSFMVIAKGEPGFPMTWECKLPTLGPLARRQVGGVGVTLPPLAQKR